MPKNAKNNLFADYEIHVADFLPQDGWSEHPERVDQTLSILSRTPFTVRDVV